MSTIDETWKDLKTFLDGVFKTPMSTGDCFTLCSYLLNELKMEAERRKIQNSTSKPENKDIEFEKDIFFLCRCEIKDTDDYHVAVCAQFLNQIFPNDSGFVVADIGLFLPRALIVRQGVLEESFLGGFHTQQILTPDQKTIISIRTVNKDSKISYYYHKS
jgi:hypothetical protein